MIRYNKGKFCALPWVFFVALLVHAQQPTPLPPAKGAVGTTIFRGQELTYTVRDGLAIHAGDIILGTAEEAAAAAPPQVGGRSQAAAQRVTRSLDLWPGGVIPYVIDDDVANSEDILRAIEEWNSKTVISLVERTMERDYVRFEAGEGVCAAHLGRRGGEQLILLTETCDRRIVVHEIGHAVGFWHEHQRSDRDRYLMVRWREVGVCADSFDLISFAQVERPYDYASAMHYGRGPNGDLPWLDTIPPGISIVSASAPAPLSSGDVDYVARLYGQPPAETTISTNPPGLEIVVDGVRYAAPATFDWTPGTKHRIEAPFVQVGNNPVLGVCCNYGDSSSREGERSTRFVFGSWTDEGRRAHSVTAGPETTWFQANYIVQLHVASRGQPPEAGGATIRPESPDGFYTVGAPVKVSAVANPGYHFLDWQGEWMPGADRINWFPGASWNPALMYVGLNGRAPRIYARFTTEPVVSIGTEGYAHGANIRDNRGWYVSLPINYGLTDFRSKFANDDGTIQIAVADGLASAVEPVPGFLRWSDGVVGDRHEEDRLRFFVREVDVSDEGGDLSTEWETHVPLYARTSPVAYFEDGESKPFGRIETYPPPLDDRKGSYWSKTDYYVQDTRVDVTAVSLHPDYRFVGWSGDAYGTERSTSLVMDGPKDVEALFSYSEYPILQLGVPTSGRLSRSWPTWGYWVYVPLDATELTVDVEMDNPETDAVLAVSEKDEIKLDDNERIRGAEFEAQLSNGTARIAITRDSSPPLAGGPYFIRVVAPEAESKGTLSAATVTSDIQIRASPRAFTFVAPEGHDPAPQTFEFRNMVDRPLAYLIHSDQEWLRVEPQEGTLAAGEAVEVTAIVNSTGVLTDIHQGNLTIVDADGMYEQGTDHLVEGGVFDIGRVVFSDRNVISLPVIFALIPPS